MSSVRSPWRNMRRHIGTLCVFIVLASGIACDESLSELAGPTPDLEPTFASIQRNVFESTDASGRRACTGCHNAVGQSSAGGLNLLHDVAYDQLVTIASRIKPGAVRVIPGDADNSYLVQKVLGTAGIAGARMPIGGPYLSDGQIFILRRWIERGAPRD